MKEIEGVTYLSVYDVAYKLGCSHQTVRNKIKAGKIKGITLMGVTYITEAEYKNYLLKGDKGIKK